MHASGAVRRLDGKVATMEFPTDVRYTKEHEWVRDEGGKCRVGISDYAQDALGDVVYVDLPEVGSSVRAGEPLGEVESTKSVSDVYSPISGTVAEVNQLLDDRPELVNEAPYGDGWLAVIEPSERAQLDELLDAGAYDSFVGKIDG